METHLESYFTIETEIDWSHVIDRIINLDIIVAVWSNVAVLMFEQHSKPVKFVLTCIGGLFQVEQKDNIALVGDVLDEICSFECVRDNEKLGVVKDDALGLREAVDHGLDAGDLGELIGLLKQGR